MTQSPVRGNRAHAFPRSCRTQQQRIDEGLLPRRDRSSMSDPTASEPHDRHRERVARLDERVCTAWKEYLAMTRAGADAYDADGAVRLAAAAPQPRRACRGATARRLRAGSRPGRVARHPPRRVTRLRALSIEDVESSSSRSACRRVPARVRARPRRRVVARAGLPVRRAAGRRAAELPRPPPRARRWRRRRRHAARRARPADRDARARGCDQLRDGRERARERPVGASGSCT